MKEIWKTIVGFKDYQISNYGRVKSLKYNKKKLLKSGVINSGYLIVCLSNSKIKKFKLIHRLIAHAFIPNADNKPQVNHKDGNKHNNHIDNLEWVDHSENMKHAYRSGLHSMKGERNSNSTLKEKDILVIHCLYLNGMNQETIGILYNITHTMVSYIVNGINWKII
jgi:hypothetical protein